MILLSVFVLWVILALVGDVAVKEHHYWIAVVCWPFCVFPAMYAYDHADFVAVTVIWACVSVLIGAMLSIFRYHERISPYQWSACFLALVAIVLSEKK